MSSFVVSNETINRVIHLLDLDSCGNPRGHFDQADQLGQQLWKLNATATGHRYREPAEPLPTFTWQPRRYTRLQMLKAAECWLYQCSEGDQFTGAELYTRVERHADQLRARIVSELPEYQAADWDAPHNPQCLARA